METRNIDTDLLKTLPLPDWAEDTHKGDRGKLLLVAGSTRVPGAAILAARAALRSGCGTVRLAVPKPLAVAIGVAVPELLVIGLPWDESSREVAPASAELLIEEAGECDALVIGPGLLAGPGTAALTTQLLAGTQIPAVVDAASLAALKSGSGRKNLVLTPHDLELEQLLGSVPEELEEKLAATATYAQKVGATLVLKGRPTHILAASGEVLVNDNGSRALGTAGSGDVLAGLTGGLLAQGVEAKTATVWGVHMHSLAGEAVARDLGEDGVLARDFIDRLPGIQKYLRRTAAPRVHGMGLRPA